MPFSTPPAPSEPPKSRILVPLTGSANKPLAEAKAMAGLIRAGSLRAARVGLPLRVAGAPCRLAVAAALIDERQRQQSSSEKDLDAEGARAIALSRQVDTL